MDVDTIIVGGGSAGCALAARLSERSAERVLLIEAGPDTPPNAVPDVIADSYPGLSYFDPRYHWTGLRVHARSPRNNDGSSKPGKLEQAKVMGGGSSINGQFAVRGFPADFDEWEAMGLQGWGWKDLRPCFRRLERDLDFGDRPEHGNDGPLPIRRVLEPDWAPYSRAIHHYLARCGYRAGLDLNAGTEDGLFPLPLTNENDRRVSTAIGYLSPEVRRRHNLMLMPDTEVRDLLLDGRQTTGVTTLTAGRSDRHHARRVIISAGALHTPPILMRAGIGPAGHLKERGIAVVHDLPGVGENLMDHPHIGCGTHLKPAGRLPRHQRRHIFFALRYSSGHPDCTVGDMFMMPVNRAGWHPLGKRMGSLVFCVNKSYSRGRVRLSPDPRAEPFVDINMLSDGRDLRRLVDAYKLMYRIMESDEVKAVTNLWFLAGYSDAVRDISIKRASNWVKTAAAAAVFGASKASRDWLARQRFGDPERIHRLIEDDEAIADWIKSAVYSGWHVSGSCRMGPDGDRMAVLDARCRVRGIEGLYVVDASAMPTTVSANTNITTIAMAEKAADLLKTAA
ncbi:MAG: GMC family oxidoreductase N-terminal domain-containing protein [Hyphomicrobiaceae bacterium]